MAPFDGVGSTEFIVFEQQTHIDSGYLRWLLARREFVEAANERAAGVQLPRVTFDKLADLEQPFAPLAEQRRIVAKVEAMLRPVDRAITRLEVSRAILLRFRRSLLTAAINGALTEDWRAKNHCDRSWESVSVSDVAHVGSGSTPLRTNGSFFARAGTPWITSSATGHAFVYEANEFVTAAAIKAHRLKLYPVGTLLVAMYGEGKTRGQVSELRIPATINQACAAIVVDPSQADREFIKLTLSANYLEMREQAEGGNQPNLSLGKIRDFPISLPTLDEQHEVVRRVSSLMMIADKIENRVKAADRQARSLPQSILTSAFAGELVPSEAELARAEGRSYETARQLLDRIRTEQGDVTATTRKNRRSLSTRATSPKSTSTRRKRKTVQDS